MSDRRAGRSSTKRQEMKEKRRKRQQRQRMIIFAVIGLASLLILAVAIAPSVRDALTPVGDIVEITPVPRPMAQDNAMGDPNAPVKIEEFSDYQCPFCKRFADEVQPKIVAQYVATGKVYFAFRSMGNWISDNIPGPGTESQDAAAAAYCAGEQNKFWEYHDILFANWEGEDVDMKQFRDCYNSGRFEDRVQQDRADGQRAGITGTPSFLINGKLVSGAQPFEYFQQEIEAALRAAESQ